MVNPVDEADEYQRGPGTEEGDVCGRDGCEGRIVLEPDPKLEDEGCTCHMGAPPCSSCVSTMPTCTYCGWREDEG